MPRFSNPELVRQWRNRLRRFEQSELTVAEFCQIEDYSVASFYRWRHRLSNDTVGGHAASFVAVELPSGSLGTDHSDRLCQDDDIGLQIELPGGALARLGRDATDEQQCRLIKNVVQTLREVTP